MKRVNRFIPIFLFSLVAGLWSDPSVVQAAPTVEFAQQTAEGPESRNPAGLEVTLSEVVVGEVRVEYRVTGGTASGNGVDYSLADGFLTFAPGETRKVLPVTIIDDQIKEGEETILITLSNPVNAFLGSNMTFTYTILDDDTVTVGFPSETSSDFEAVSPAVLEVTLSKAAEETVTVNYAVSGTAVGNGVDFSLPDGVLTFKPGETGQKIVIDITDDDLQEVDKTILVTLTLPENMAAKLGRFSTHTYWILDDDSPAENITLFKQEIESSEAGKKLVILGPKTLTVNPRGLAVDKHGNLYISDQGPSKGEKEGSILMWPKGQARVLRIITGLTRPGDVDLSPDQKQLIVAGPKGDIYRLALGLSLRIANIDPLTGNTRVHLFSSALGEQTAKGSPDGYFHFPGLLVPNQQGDIYADIEHNGKTKRFSLTLGQPGESGEPYGHAVIELDF